MTSPALVEQPGGCASWDEFSKALTGLLKGYGGQIPLASLGALWRTARGEPLDLGGYKIAACIHAGVVKGVATVGEDLCLTSTLRQMRAPPGFEHSSQPAPIIAIPSAASGGFETGQVRVVDSVRGAAVALNDINSCLAADRRTRRVIAGVAISDDGGICHFLVLCVDAASRCGSATQGASPAIVIIDVHAITALPEDDAAARARQDLARELQPLLGDPSIFKLLFDATPTAMTLEKTLGLRLSGAVDVQLGYELLQGRALGELADIVEEFGGPTELFKFRELCEAATERPSSSGGHGGSGGGRGGGGTAGRGGGGGGGGPGSGGAGSSGGGGGSSSIPSSGRWNSEGRGGDLSNLKRPLAPVIKRRLAVVVQTLIGLRTDFETALPGPAWDVVARGSQARGDYAAAQLLEVGSFRRMTFPAADKGCRPVSLSLSSERALPAAAPAGGVNGLGNGAAPTASTAASKGRNSPNGHGRAASGGGSGSGGGTIIHGQKNSNTGSNGGGMVVHGSGSSGGMVIHGSSGSGGGAGGGMIIHGHNSGNTGIKDATAAAPAAARAASGGRGKAATGAGIVEAAVARTRDADVVSWELWKSCCDKLIELGASRAAEGVAAAVAADDEVPPAAFLASGPRVLCDPDLLLQLLPEQYRKKAIASVETLMDVQFDLGRMPYATISGRRVPLAPEGTLVTAAELQEAVRPLMERFGPDNRACLDGELHRISALRDLRDRDVFGLTMRMGRYVHGVADVVHDILFASPAVGSRGRALAGAAATPTAEDVAPWMLPSVLVLGPPGAGKTTIIREISRQLAERWNVMIVDTSNEICGDGAIPHKASTGFARRIMVPPGQQHNVMLEAVKNHTPDVVVIDEISRKQEAQACRDIEQRGVRLVATAHGDLKSLVGNPELNSLVGGKQQVTLGDAAAGPGSKLRTERAGEPVFHVVIELRRGKDSDWRVIREVGAAVDGMLGNAPSEADGGVGRNRYRVELRRRKPAVAAAAAAAAAAEAAAAAGSSGGTGGSNSLGGGEDALAGPDGPFFLFRHDIVLPSAR